MMLIFKDTVFDFEFTATSSGNVCVVNAKDGTYKLYVDNVLIDPIPSTKIKRPKSKVTRRRFQNPYAK